MRRLRFLLLPFVAALLLTGLVMVPAASAAPSDAVITLRITAPEGVPAAVRVSGIVTAGGRVTRVATKPAAGTSATVRLTVPAGVFAVTPSRVVVGGVTYASRSSRPVVVAVPRLTFPVDVGFTAAEGARDLHADSLARTEVGLSWTAPPGARFALRRTTGESPVLVRTQGTEVRTTGNTAVDRGLRPGTRYTYALFTQYRGRWSGPTTVTVGTAPPAGSTDAAFVAPASTLLAAPADVVSAAPTGAGVDTVLTDRVRPLAPGAAVVLPISDALPGGFLGVVDRIAADGRVVSLRAGSLSDAFDLYDVAVEQVDEGVAEGASTFAAPGDAGRAGAPERGQTPPEDAAPAEGEVAAFAAAVPTARVGVECSGDVESSVSLDPGLRFDGHFRSRLDKYRFLGQDIPVGAALDMSLAVTVTGAATVETSAGTTCSLRLPTRTWLISASPVPLSAVLEPTAEIGISGAVEIENLGVTATGGFRIAASLTPRNGASFTGDRIASAAPLTPQITANGTVSVEVGGELVVGPGAGTPDAGVIAGVRGELGLLDAEFGPRFPIGDGRFNACLGASARSTIGLSLVAKAWLANWNFEQSITADALQGVREYPGSPWVLPSGCGDLPGGGGSPPDSLFGPGVTKVGDSTTGGPEQWGFVEGFVPGAEAWVLSTGLISNAVGDPGTFASTDLGGAGDAALTDLAGYPTYDAATYEVTLVPTGSTLNVRYVFASEEYPEYVGSTYNDVMAVRVDGVDCAVVPGTTDPVAINTVNAGANAAYFVDNTQGATGYGTTMDGLTVPLSCSVPVTPGQAVTVQIAVADTSDHSYDSAVALVDGGIWTE